MAPSATSQADGRSEDGSASGPPDFSHFGDNIDASTFEQILEMDDDEEEREFSRSIVYDFFQQAENTFLKMDESLKERDLASLSSLGHFLKGSSATLGLAKVRDSCEKIQHFGAGKNEDGSKEESEETCLSSCKHLIAQAKEEFNEAEGLLKKFYEGQGAA